MNEKIEKVEKPEKPAPPAKVKGPTEEQVLAEMKRLAGNGVVEFTSTLLRDKLELDKESGRDQVRRAMKKLEKDGKVVISRKAGKKGRYIYRLK